MNFNKLKNISAMLLFGAIVFGSGCKKFLEEQDPSHLSPETFYNIPAHAEAGIAVVDDATRFIGQSSGIFCRNFQMLEAPTGTSTTETAQETDLNNLYSLVYDGNNKHIINWWTGIYNVIARANLVLEKIPGITPMDEAQKTRILGEARFLRAWAYFYAVRLWGDIPLTTKPQTASSEDFFPSRTPQEEVYKIIVDDLVTAEASGLPWMDVSGRISLAVVKLQLSKVYLTMAGQPMNKGAAYYKLAADKANEVITYANSNPGIINLFESYSDVHSVAQENKIEHIFEIQYLSSVESNNSWQQMLLPNFKNITVFSGIGSQIPTTSFYNSYESGDLRTKNQVGYFYNSYYAGGSGAVFDLGGPYIFKQFDVVANGSPGNAGTGASNLNVPQIRFAEVLLIYSEAQNEVSGPDITSYDAFKRIRNRAQLVTPAIGTYNQATFREAIWRERWHELCYEGITWFDLVRLRKVYNESTNGFDDFVGHINKSSNQPLQAKHLLFPLPIPEMRNNPNLIPQNPDY